MLSSPARFRRKTLATFCRQLPTHFKRCFTVLALESSADDTCAAIVTSEREILSNVVISQLLQHEKFRGIEPLVAIKLHQKNMPLAVGRALKEANVTLNQIDGIAFSRGPGMPGSLSVSYSAAGTLAAALGKPLVGVHHMQAHTLTPFLTSPADSVPQFPFLTLLISGGHTMLVLATSLTSFRILATTVDSSIGRAFDRVSTLLQLRWTKRGPGHALEQFCLTGEEPGSNNVNRTDNVASASESITSQMHSEIDISVDARSHLDLPDVPPFAVPLSKRLVFSYAGLHSAVERHISLLKSILHPSSSSTSGSSQRSNSNPDDSSNLGSSSSISPGFQIPYPQKLALARAFQDAAIAQLEEKLSLALKQCFAEGVHVRHLVVSGGVASNNFLRDRLKICLETKFPNEKIAVVFPPVSLCTDNAAMIAWASMHRFLNGDTDDYSMSILPKWSLEDLEMGKQS